MKTLRCVGVLVTLLAALPAFTQVTGDSGQTLQHPRPVQLIEGQGVARNREGRVMEFRMRAAKFENNRLEGSFQFSSGNDREMITISGREIREMGVQGKIGQFNAPAVLVVRNREGVREFRGRVNVRVNDRWVPRDGVTDVPEPDLISVTFVQDGSDRRWTFEGGVFRGDIVVRSNQ
ncbi:MAG: hypothetical protein KF812_09155 [Fimbriimonadaceae bacterium]|nr:hypothetical protein [Fimbriimonadaceae bacterium]